MPPKRFSKRDFLPASVRNRGLGNVIRVSTTAEASSTIGNGEDAVFSALYVNQTDADMIGEFEWSLWQGSISASNLIPDGSNVDISDYQIVGPWNEWAEGRVLGLAGLFDTPIAQWVLVSNLYIRNISAGSQTINARARVRYITNKDVVE